MHKRRAWGWGRGASRLALVVAGLTALGVQSGCRGEGEGGGEAPASADAGPRAEPDVPAPPPSSRYGRTLAAQLDLVPPDADGFVVVRDLRPLVAQARVVEALMAGPLSRAIPALAQLGGGTGEARLAQLEQAREVLALVLAGIEGAGMALDSGVVVALGQADPIVVFAAEELDRLLALAALATGSDDLADHCRALASQPGWSVCSLGGPESLDSYAPANQGQALGERLRARVGLDGLDAINVAVSLADAAQPIDLVLRTDPELWELSMPLEAAPAASAASRSTEGSASDALIRGGPATALRALIPGTSFAWARVDPDLLGARATGLEVLDASRLTGELFLGVNDPAAGLIAQVGVGDDDQAIVGVEAMTKLVPEGEVTPDELPDLRLSFDRARLELDGRSLPSIGVVATGATAEGWATSLGVEPRARLWAHGGYLSLALGQSQAIPAALAALGGDGPSAASLDALPVTLAGALGRGEVGFVVHLILDHWQAPPSAAELDTLLAGLGADLGAQARPAAASIFAAFEVLAPWSTLDLWARRSGPERPWSLNLSLVPFAAPGSISAEEQAAAEDALTAALTGADAEQAYAALAQGFPDSPHASRYRARLGQAPAHHAAVGMVELGLLGAVVVPLIERQLRPEPGSEAPAQTQSILAAALLARERAGRCKPLIGRAGPTPPLSVSCRSAPDRRCHVSEDLDADASEAARYPLSAWTDDPIWAAIGFQPRADLAHQAHYSLVIESRGKLCHIEVLAQVELGSVGVYASYRRVATVGADGATTLVPLEIQAGADGE